MWRLVSRGTPSSFLCLAPFPVLSPLRPLCWFSGRRNPGRQQSPRSKLLLSITPSPDKHKLPPADGGSGPPNPPIPHHHHHQPVMPDGCRAGMTCRGCSCVPTVLGVAAQTHPRVALAGVGGGRCLFHGGCQLGRRLTVCSATSWTEVSVQSRTELVLLARWSRPLSRHQRALFFFFFFSFCSGDILQSRRPPWAQSQPLSRPRASECAAPL